MLEILYFKKLHSTQKHLISLIELALIDSPTAVVAKIQTKGIGSRNNSWECAEGNIFLSVALKVEQLSPDIPPQCYSLYFGYIIKEVVKMHQKDVWLKWPNDIYVKNHKVGGLITQKKENFIILGLGLNLISNARYFGLNVKTDKYTLIEDIIKSIQKRQKWKEIFSKYRLEFENSKDYKTTYKEEKISLKDAILLNDGSIEVAGKRIYNLR